MEARLLSAIKSDLLYAQSVNRFKAKLVQVLRRPKGNHAQIAKLEAEIRNYADVLGQGFRSPALLERLQAAESTLERLRAASRVVDVEAAIAALPVAIRRYRALVADLGNAPIDVTSGREIIRGIVGTIPVRPGADGIPIALHRLPQDRERRDRKDNKQGSAH